MNKRQAKKKEKKEILLCGLKYREDRLLMRMYHEHIISQKHSKTLHKDNEILVEIGIYTEEEVANKFQWKEKRRWKQLRRLEGKQVTE